MRCSIPAGVSCDGMFSLAFHAGAGIQGSVIQGRADVDAGKGFLDIHGALCATF